MLTPDLQSHVYTAFFIYLILRLYMHVLFHDGAMLSQLQP